MTSRTLFIVTALIVGCRSGDHSPQPAAMAPHDAGSLRKVPLSRPDDDLVSFERADFKGRDRQCKVGTLVRVYPNTEIQPDRVPLSVEAFSIDRRTVSCVDFDRCVESGHCAGSARLRSFPDQVGGPRCREQAAIVSHEAAEEYCKWRGMSLPTLYQWQRAIRGIDGSEFPGGHTFDPSKLRQREVVSADGVIYSTSYENPEWLRDQDCGWMTPGGADARLRFVAMPEEGGRQLTDYGLARLARIRCVRPAADDTGPKP